MSDTTTPTLPRLKRADEVSAELGLPLATVYRLGREGTVPCVRIGRTMRFRAADLEAWLGAGGTAPRSEAA